MKECPIRYLIKALLMLSRPGAEIREDFQNCTSKCKWYKKGRCLYVETNSR